MDILASCFCIFTRISPADTQRLNFCSCFFSTKTELVCYFSSKAFQTGSSQLLSQTSREERAHPASQPASQPWHFLFFKHSLFYYHQTGFIHLLQESRLVAASTRSHVFIVFIPIIKVAPRFFQVRCTWRATRRRWVGSQPPSPAGTASPTGCTRCCGGRRPSRATPPPWPRTPGATTRASASSSGVGWAWVAAWATPSSPSCSWGPRTRPATPASSTRSPTEPGAPPPASRCMVSDFTLLYHSAGVFKVILHVWEVYLLFWTTLKCVKSSLLRSWNIFNLTKSKIIIAICIKKAF